MRAVQTQVNPNLWPAFLTLDDSPVPAVRDVPGGYSSWGTMTLSDGTTSAEPNNLVPPEFCVVANFSQAYNSVWGWSDQNCDDKHMFVCKIPGEAAWCLARAC
jgi:hypothetical protein